MAVTTTQRLGLPQWGLGSDSPSRTGFNDAFKRIDDRVAVDLGEAGGASLPVSDVVAGRYAPTVEGAYRKLHRRTATGWQQIGGNTWSETTYARAEAALATTAPARIVSHPNLPTPGITENWDGSSVRGGRQAVGDLNSGAPGAFHAGDTTATVDLVQRGRFYALTAGNGGRGFVAAAHAAAAGPLFAARDSGGSEPWLVDSLGRMRAQAATAFGAAALTANVPMVSQPGASDLTAMDLIAASGKPALRLFRAVGDQIGSVLPDFITLGKPGWAGGRVDLLAPTINLVGSLDITGNTVLDALTASGAVNFSGDLNVGDDLDVDGSSVLADVSATSLSVTGDVSTTGRLRIPSTNPTGTAAGQIRAKTSPEWGGIEVYDGSAWRTQFGGSGRQHEWGTSGTSLPHAVDTRVTSMTKKSGSGSIVTSETGGYFRLNRAGLWSLSAYMYTDINSEGQHAFYVTWENDAPLGFVMIDRRDRRLNGNTGQLDSLATWVGYVTANQAAQRMSCMAFQHATTGSACYLTFSFRMEYLGA